MLPRSGDPSFPQVGDLQGRASDNTKRGRRLAPLRVFSMGGEAAVRSPGLAALRPLILRGAPAASGRSPLQVEYRQVGVASSITRTWLTALLDCLRGLPDAPIELVGLQAQPLRRPRHDLDHIGIAQGPPDG